MSSKLPYHYDENCEKMCLYFILESSRSEPPQKQAHVLLNAASLAGEGELKQNIHNTACELFDVEQIVQRHIALIRKVHADEIAKDPNWAYLLERMEGEPLELKLELINSMVAFERRPDAIPSDEFMKTDSEVRRFIHNFDTLLFKIRTNYYERSNREAAAEFEREEAQSRITPPPEVSPASSPAA